MSSKPAVISPSSPVQPSGSGLAALCLVRMEGWLCLVLMRQSVLGYVFYAAFFGRLEYSGFFSAPHIALIQLLSMAVCSASSSYPQMWSPC